MIVKINIKTLKWGVKHNCDFISIKIKIKLLLMTIPVTTFQLKKEIKSHLLSGA